MSSIDDLTKISNHRALIEHLNLGMADADRAGTPLYLAIFDIDNFKKVNDSRGHVCGDRVIIEVAEILAGTTRKSDFVGRYGGEEFMILFPDTELATAREIADQVRKAVENHLFPEGVRVTISGGVRQYGGESVTELIESADKHLYQAKDGGKNQIAPALLAY